MALPSSAPSAPAVGNGHQAPSPCRSRQDAIVERASETAREMLAMDMAFVSDTRAGTQAFTCVVGDADSFGIEPSSAVPLEGTYCERLLDGRLENIVHDSASHPVVRDLPATAQASVGAYIGVPIELSDGTTFGTFCCISHGPAPALEERDVRFLTVLAKLVADQIEAEERVAEERRAELAAGNVQALLAALGARDGYTEQHSEEVVRLAMSVGRRLRLGARELEELQYVALLHDIGKIGVRDTILHKPGPLDPDEWAEMRKHPEIGERIVASMPSLAHLAPTIRAEHERWDGTGYPDRLLGDDIPLLARIVLVCDAFHAMTSDRPYRAALPVEQALAELARHAGSQFCPRTAAAAISVLAER